ncbi:PfkB family carbohydrate kinase [Pseudomonas typographi]|uniref:Sugar kinase n=1 Tax=Pseudomonas typographi TaxID=2715964 RepID=A0ABR7Z791_9PSED|nr:PfkB family carbohydrate kinase [Pseudomonas typographi]MBD1601415.1 sugar kinase [Pseudomonas typographi]
MPARLLYTGQVVVDLVMPVEALPAPGQEVLAHSAGFEVGGGFNVMAAAARNGLPTWYLGRHGTGRFGDLARQAMLAEGIQVCLPPTAGQDTGVSVALVDASAERSFISYVGAEGQLSTEDLAGVVPSAGDWIMVSGYSLLHPGKAEGLLGWLALHAGRCAVAFDPGPLASTPGTPQVAQLLPGLRLWSSNYEEALRFTATAELATALAELVRRLPANAWVIVRDGPAGCWLARGRERWQVPGFSVQAVDSNGAGDAHTGVLLAGLAAGLAPYEAARHANAAAALAVTQRGPATCPGREALEAFLQG